ncbi:MAG: hypothetical protein ACFE0O_14170 [Opitutales bacterium]
MNQQPSRLSRRHGSALAVVVILTFALTAALGAALSWSVTEKRINAGHVLRHSAKNAAESLAEYGFADLIQRFTKKTSFPLDALEPGNDPLTIPGVAEAFYNGSTIDLDESELIGGVVPPGIWVYIDPRDPANEFDPLKGTRAFVRNVEVYAKARATSEALGGMISDAHTIQVLQVRDSPLFAHGIFYNMDLELHPGPKMTMAGPVHTNRNAYLQALDEIDFQEGITAAGAIYHGFKKTGGITQTGKVEIRDGSGVKQEMFLGGNRHHESAYLDHEHQDWREDSAQRWDGYVQDQEHGVPVLNPVGVNNYVPDDPTTSTNELLNHAYSLIEPVLPRAHADSKADAVRQEKFAWKAGLIFRVEESATAPTGFSVNAYKWQRTNPNDPTSDLVLDVNGDPIAVPVTLPTGVIGNADNTMRDIDVDGEPELYAESSGEVVGGMYDHRQDEALDMVTIDMAALRATVDDNANATGTDLSTTYWGGSYDPEKDWNGIVYVEFPREASSGGRADKVVKGKYQNLALQIVDGERIPNPSFAPEEGMSLATNAPLYVVGNFNADGSSHTDDSNAPDGTDEPPAALASDTLSILSESWYPTSYGPGRDNRRYSNESNTGDRDAETFTEISAAILTGLKPTITDDEAGGTSNWTSGGAHNFPRFLEDWNTTLTIRGSLVALFESEIHDSAMPTNFNHFYSPPTRDWGFNDLFREGRYPPGTPNTRTFRRLAFTDVTATEYQNRVDAINYDG